MARRQTNTKYKIPSYYIENGKETFIRGYVDERQTISQPMGMSLQLDDGEVFYETDADVTFRKNFYIKTDLYGKLRIKEIISRKPDPNDGNALRGKPRFITQMVIA